MKFSLGLIVGSFLTFALCLASDLFVTQEQQQLNRLLKDMKVEHTSTYILAYSKDRPNKESFAYQMDNQEDYAEKLRSGKTEANEFKIMIYNNLDQYLRNRFILMQGTNLLP